MQNNDNKIIVNAKLCICIFHAKHGIRMTIKGALQDSNKLVTHFAITC